ncbi:hypothetical protein BDY19DRAFT_1046479 [Irpex rosettiformis]|uniref:Uncharacterized protein n=1 Tax=Irpex rosettiformis TaxID=378272 RepID=A0ACB8UB65_9APHY|nr:hypothetical protein BDY19DRAFT_1046479 [Irpex rosettiformis]
MHSKVRPLTDSMRMTLDDVFDSSSIGTSGCSTGTTEPRETSKNASINARMCQRVSGRWYERTKTKTNRLSVLKDQSRTLRTYTLSACLCRDKRLGRVMFPRPATRWSARRAHLQPRRAFGKKATRKISSIKTHGNRAHFCVWHHAMRWAAKSMRRPRKTINQSRR